MIYCALCMYSLSPVRRECVLKVTHVDMNPDMVGSNTNNPKDHVALLHLHTVLKMIR